MSKNKCEHCNKPMDFDVDCQEVVDMGDFTTETCKWVHSDCLEEYEMVSCDTCGDCHEVDNVPFGCQTGGEE